MAEPDTDQAQSAPARVDPIRAGLRCRCPNCGQGPLFQGFLKPVPVCTACGFDLASINTGDGPAVFIMQISGGIVLFSLLYAQIAWNLPLWLALVVGLPAVLIISLGLMRPAKGLMIALHMRQGVQRD